MRLPTPPTVADLVDSTLAGSRVLGGAAGLGAEVTRVALWDGEDGRYAVSRGELVMLAPGVAGGRSGPVVEILMRRAASAMASALVLPPGTIAPLSTARLADRLALPVVVLADGQGVLDAASLVRAQADAVPRADVDLLLELSDRLAACADLDEIQRALAETVRARVALASSDRGVLAGDASLADLLPPDEELEGVLAPGPGHTVAVSAGAAGGVPPVWILVHADAPTERWRVLAERAARLARGHVRGVEARRRLADARARAASDRLMTEILQAPERAPTMLAAQARRLGFRLGDWHVGVAVAVRGIVPSALALETVREAVEAPGRLTPFLRTSTGWVAWVSSEDAPTATHVRTLGLRLRQAVEALRAGYPQGQVLVGVGAGARDVVGVARTVGQAQQAVLVAGTGGSDQVRVVQDLGASSLLLGWYGSGVFREVADDILAPLRAAGDEEMVRTLTAYLDRACSASHTARVLGVHRNTVNQRIARAERLLGVSLADSDTRLALQLALRAHDQPRLRP